MLHCVILEPAEGVPATADFVFEGQRQVVIGRSRDCSLRLEDPTVSRRHCLIDSSDEAVWVLDLGSLNGTYVNGVRLGGSREKEPPPERKTCELHDGDRLRVGARDLIIRLRDDAPREGGDILLDPYATYV